MKILYKNKKIEKLCSDKKVAIRELGLKVASKLFQALFILKEAHSLNEIFAIKTFNLHPLNGELKGKYSLYLGKMTGFRLILVLLNQEENKKYDENTIEYINVIMIEEVSNHYE